MAKEQGIDFFGVADLAIAESFIQDQGGDYLSKFPKAVSVGIRLLDAVVDQLHMHNDRGAVFAYRGLYNSVNSRLDHAALFLARRIQEEGYQAYPVPASQTVDSDRLTGVVSHKLAANLAGLGWIGRSCLLITPNCGPRARFATVFTDAPLKTGFPMKNNCGDCKACVTICPVKAFTGASFKPSEPREARFNAHLCQNYMKKRQRELGEELCGLCVYVCPHGHHRRTSKHSRQ